MKSVRPRVLLLAPALVLLHAGCATPPAAPPASARAEAAGPMEATAPLDAAVPVFEISQLERSPIPRFQARPVYPFALRRAGVSGGALVDFVVDVDGNVRNAYPVGQSLPEFGAAAVDAVVRWKFTPGIKDGHPVNTHMQVPVNFSIGLNGG